MELGALTWVTYHPLTQKIHAGNEVQNFLDFKEMKFYVRIKATTTARIPVRTHDDEYFQVYFEDLEKLYCANSKILEPLLLPEGLEI